MEAQDSRRRKVGGSPGPRSKSESDIQLPHLYMHATKRERNLPLIASEGLRAGATQGIGDPDTGKRFKDSIFVAKRKAMSFVTMEAPGGNVAVVSTREPNPDQNYKGGRLQLGDAGYFSQTTIEPLRNAKSQTHGGPYSFVFPMTPRTREGAKAMLDHLNPGSSFELKTAEEVLTNAFKEEFGPYIDLRSRSPSPRRGRSSSRESSPERSRSPSPDPGGQLLFQMDD